MAWTPTRLDPDRQRRRLQLLAARAGAIAPRRAAGRLSPRRDGEHRLRSLIAQRRRLAG
ncbi:hypothetical protein [Rhizomonospora bruguierae]|uniref:hypothetical protein n=1 Tax=Rhizomonospora bruguierae TaxID=1581705 RepID=UPI001BCAF0D6|nr:hypothetical protein [Micromonospora sp. NBRC 107566]